VVSSNSEEVIRRVLGPELAELISLYACGASLFGKARKFKQVTARGVSRDKVICIGDETRDIEAARAVGLDCGAVGWVTPSHPSWPNIVRRCRSARCPKLFRTWLHPMHGAAATNLRTRG